LVRSIQTETAALEWSVAERPRAGETSSGDRSLVRTLSGDVLVGVVDALGHGTEAAAAASKAIAVLERYAHEPLPSLVQRAHTELRGSRGAVMSLALFRPEEHAMTWLGVGNVEGMLISADPRSQPQRSLLVSRAGIVGSDLPKVNPWVVPLNVGDTLLFTTDGIRPGFADGLNLRDTTRQLADRILANFAKDTDDALVLVVRYLGDH